MLLKQLVMLEENMKVESLSKLRRLKINKANW